MVESGPYASPPEVRADAPTSDWWSAWTVAVLLGVLAALPTVAYGLTGGGLVTDDWKILGEIAYGGLGEKILTRPIGYGWYGLEYWLFGQAVWPHLLVLASANAAVAVLLYRLLLRHIPGELALVAAVIWVVLPNRSSTRFWAAATPIVASLGLVLLVALLRSAERPWLTRPRLLVSALLAAAVLTYEGVLGLVLGLVLVEVFRERALVSRCQTAVLVGAAPAAATLWVWVNAPRREHFEAFSTIDRIVSVLVGDALLPEGFVGLGPLLLIPVAWAVSTLVLPSFRPRIEESAILAGVVVAFLGLLPFLAAGFPFSTTGLNDRGGYVASVGVVLVLAGTIGLAARIARPLVLVGTLVVIALCAPGTWADMDDYRSAIDDGKRLRVALDAWAGDMDLSGGVVIETLPNNGGVQFLNTTAELRRYLAVVDDSLTVADLDGLELHELHRTLDSYEGTVMALEGDRLVVIGHQ